RDTFCDDIECERGECSFEEGGCANADHCEGDDEACLEGFFCNSHGQCQPDLCEQNEVECQNGGECIPSSGECGNPTTCEEDGDCVDSPPHLCVGNECRPESSLCGDATGDGGCPANQECELDDDEAECVEPAQCETSFDCQQDRQCGGLECIDPIPCKDDYFEPNDSVDEATPFHDVAENNTARGSLCEDDTDVFTFDSREIIDATTRGELVVQADVPRRDQGLGQLEIEVTDEDGNSDVASTGSMGREGSATVSQLLGVNEHGEYTVEISPDGEFSESGLEYDLSVDLIPEETVDACDGAQPIRTDSRVSGTTEDARSTFIDSSCVEGGEDLSDVIYELELDAPQEVTFELTPQVSTADLSLSLLEDCMRPASEVECVNNEGADGGESLTTLLDEGTHFIVVQAAEVGAGGPFELTLDSVYTACTEETNYCSDRSTANRCTNDGGRYDSIDCDQGCNPSTGDCYPPRGDECLDAPTIALPNDFDDDEDDVDLPQTFEETFDMGQARDHYQLDEDAVSSDEFCMELGDEETTRTDGSDMTFELEIPSDTSVTAEVNFAEEAVGSLYLVEDCHETTQTCAAGAVESTDQENTEQLRYTNASDEDESMYLIVDTAEDESPAEAVLDVTYDEVVCEPGTPQCNGDALEECDDYGVSFEEAEEACPIGCATDDDCEAGDDDCQPAFCSATSCEAAEPVPADGDEHSYTFDLDDFEDDHDINGASCMASSSEDSDGKEAVFSVDADADDVIRVDWAPVEDGALYITTDCDDIQASCETGYTNSDTDPLSLEHVAQQDGVHYIFADVDYDDGGYYGYYETEYGESEFDVEVLEGCDVDNTSPTCQSGDVEYCAEPGGLETYTCSGGCTDGTCDDEDGDFCFDAEDITSDASQDGGVTRTIDWTDYDDYLSGEDVCGLTSSELSGSDAYYKVDMEEDDWLVAELDNGTSYDDPALIVTSECDSPDDDCLASDESTSSAEVEYQADKDETVYLIADTDGSTSTDQFDLDVELISPECDVDSDSPQCDGEDVEYCQGYGTWEPYSCDGGCTDGECDDGQGEACFDTENITSEASQDGGMTRTIDWTEYDDFLSGDDICGLSSSELSGSDAFFEIDMEEDDWLLAELDNGSSYDDPALIVTSECDSPDDDCLASDESTSSAEVEYQADKDETVYLIADTDGSSSTNQFDLDVELISPECSASDAWQCDGDDLEYCGDYSQWETYSCDGGCTNGECDTASSEVCFDAEDITSDASQSGGTTITETWGDFEDDYDSYDCGISTSLGAEDAVYKLSLDSGDQIDASVSASSYVWTSLTVSSECPGLEESCEEGSYSSSTSSTLQYTADSNETVYLTVDGDVSGGSSRDFTLDVEIN
ncbi:MAG: hypothetical protein ACOCV2_00445, partial [Persicimonas sp.]